MMSRLLRTYAFFFLLLVVSGALLGACSRSVFKDGRRHVKDTQETATKDTESKDTGSGPEVCYIDADDDGHGNPDQKRDSCDPDRRCVSTGDDCDDTDPTVNPEAAERCNGADDDCDGETDESDAVDKVLWYFDEDGDGYGTATGLAIACDQPSGYVATGTDCDDEDARTYPGAIEACRDGVVNDCFGSIGEAETYCTLPATWVPDSANAVIHGPSDEGCFGYSLSLSGDANGDGISDLLTGDPCGASDNGLTYLFHGPLSGDVSSDEADAIFHGQSYDASGALVTFVPDLDNDGLDDVMIVSAMPYHERVQVVYAPFSGNIALLEEQEIRGEAHSELGNAVTAPGDIDSDGLADVLIGAPGTGRGMTYVFLGPVAEVTGLSDAAATISGTSSARYSGVALAGEGDSDGDGINDLLMGGAPGNTYCTGDSTPCWPAWLLLGPFSGDRSLDDSDAIFYAEYNFDHTGFSVSSGDLNGDGLDDLVLGVPDTPSDYEAEWDMTIANGGAAYVVYGPVAGDVELAEADAKIWRGESWTCMHCIIDGIGFSVSARSDLDGDGVKDLFVGGVDNGSSIVYGPVAGTIPLAEMDIVFEPASWWFGWGVSGGGDTNGDGLQDLFLGNDSWNMANLFLGGSGL